MRAAEDGEALGGSACMGSLAKPGEQITGIVDGQIVPAMETPLLTSASTPWFGFLLEKHNAGGRGDISWGWHRAHVTLITKGQLSFRVRSTGGPQDYVGRAGSVCVFPSGFDETRFCISQSKFEAIVVELDPALLESFFGDQTAVGTSTLVPQITIQDRYIAILLRAMAAEISQGCPGGALYGHALSLALASYLDRKFSVKWRPGKRKPWPLAGAKSWGTI